MGEPWSDAMREIAAGGDVQQACDRASNRQTEGVRQMLREEGREDLVADLDRKLRESRLGLTRARAIWHTISPAQRRVLILLSLDAGRALVPCSWNRNHYGMIGGKMDAIADICGAPTIRCLHSRSLIEATGANVFHYALTEQGRFVLKHGPVDPTRPDHDGSE